jgi:hypothetical protein
MKTLFKLWHKLTDKNFDVRLQNALMIYKEISNSTQGKTPHFYNNRGDKVRGFHVPEKKFVYSHPLLEKYN